MIVRFLGGLCNQLFQWSFGRSVAEARKEPIQYQWRTTSWPYALKSYNLGIEFNDDGAGPVYNESTFAFDPAVYTAQAKLFIGYWQSERYFSESIRKEIKTRPTTGLTHALENMLGSSSVSIHVRRGDYLKVTPTNVLGMDYYNRAIEHVHERVMDAKFFIFSDDTEWCVRNFPSEMKVLSSTATNQHDDLHLLSHCRHSILGNSTFSWWGAWLGEGDPSKIVVAPKRWFAEDWNLDTKDLIPERWTKL